MSPRMCGILKIALREGEKGHKIRLAPEDVVGEVDSQGKAIEPGLYFCCIDAWEKFRKIVAARYVREELITKEQEAYLNSLPENLFI